MKTTALRERITVLLLLACLALFAALMFVPAPWASARATKTAEESPTTAERITALEAAIKALQEDVAKLKASPESRSHQKTQSAAPEPSPTPTLAVSAIPTPSPTAAASVTPSKGADGAIKITKITPNHNSCIVEFEAFPGAVDYRIYDPAHLHGNRNLYKYSGGGLKIEINGLDPAAARLHDYVVEAVDCLGPYQEIKGDTKHNDMHSINGQGPSTNIPKVLARSKPFKPQIKAQPWPTQTGAVSLFRDTFDDTSAATTQFTQVPLPALTPAQSKMNQEFYGKWQTRYRSKNWLIDFLGHERGKESVFIHQRHLMEILLDGEKRNNNASSVLQPLANGKPVVFDLGDGKIVHLTFEVDAHFQSRRWCEVQLKPAEDTFMTPGKFVDVSVDFRPTESGNLIRWQIQSSFHLLDVFQGDPANINKTKMETQIDTTWGPNSERFDKSVNITRSEYYLPKPDLNGTMADLDLRHRFDLYLSKTEYALYEEGKLLKRRTWKSPLPFTRMSAGFLHQVYHTAAEMPGAEGGEPYYQYINHSDERHWNNFGIEVVPQFPK